MGQRENFAAVMVAQIKSNEEDCAEGMGRITILLTN